MVNGVLVMCLHIVLSLSLSLAHDVTLQVSVSIAEAGGGEGDSAVVGTMVESEVTPGGQMWSGGGEDRPEQLMAPDVQEEVSLLGDQRHD